MDTTTELHVILSEMDALGVRLERLIKAGVSVDQIKNAFKKVTGYGLSYVMAYRLIYITKQIWG